MSGLGPPDQEAVEEGRQGVWVEAPEGAVGQVDVGGGDYRGCAGVLGRQIVRYGSDRAPGGGGQGSEAEEAGPGLP